MSEITIRDLSEVKELNEQVMIATVGGHGWAAKKRGWGHRRHPWRGNKFGHGMYGKYAYGHNKPLLDLDINVQTQIITVVNSPGSNITAVQTNA